MDKQLKTSIITILNFVFILVLLIPVIGGEDTEPFVKEYEGVELTYEFISDLDKSIYIDDTLITSSQIIVILSNNIFRTVGDQDLIWSEFNIPNVGNKSYITEINFKIKNEIISTYLFVPLKSGEIYEFKSSGEVTIDYSDFYENGAYYDDKHGWLTNYEKVFLDVNLKINLINVNSPFTTSINSSDVATSNLRLSMIFVIIPIVLFSKRKKNKERY